MAWELSLRRWKEADSTSARTEVPRSQEEGLSPFERDALWANHARWTMDHIQHRLELASQLALGALGIQGVLITLVSASFVGQTDHWALRLNAAALVGLFAAAGIVLIGAFPRKVLSIDPETYRAGWRLEHTETPWPSPDQQFAEELLQLDEKDRSPLVEAERLTTRRLAWIRRGLALSGVSLALVIVGTLWPVIGDLT